MPAHFTHFLLQGTSTQEEEICKVQKQAGCMCPKGRDHGSFNSEAPSKSPVLMASTCLASLELPKKRAAVGLCLRTQ